MCWDPRVLRQFRHGCSCRLLQPGLPIGGLEGTFLNFDSDPECLRLTRSTIPQDLLWNKGAYSHNMPKSSLDRRTLIAAHFAPVIPVLLLIVRQFVPSESESALLVCASRPLFILHHMHKRTYCPTLNAYHRLILFLGELISVKPWASTIPEFINSHQELSLPVHDEGVSSVYSFL